MTRTVGEGARNALNILLKCCDYLDDDSSDEEFRKYVNTLTISDINDLKIVATYVDKLKILYYIAQVDKKV